MPSLVKIKVERGRDLPAADKTNVSTEQTTDAYVEVKLDDQVQRTSTCRKSDNPVWNEEFRFELIDDSVLQDAPVELKCFDHDIYSSEMIGVVYIDLNPLIMRTAHGSHRNMVISGWFPLFDTTRGVRGALLVTVKLQFIGNENPFGDSSAGVQFFSSSQLSSKCFIIQEVIGFVEDLVVEDNPENTWQDYFRKNKSQNDSRLKVLYNLSAEVRRELGKKVLESGGNAVLAYSVHFDTEGASGIVARAYGTACKLLKVDDEANTVVVPLQHVESIIPQCASEWRSIVDGTGCMALIQRDTAELLSLRLARDMNLSNSTGSGGGSSTNKSEGLIWAQADESRMVHFLQLTPFGATQSKTTGGAREHAGSTGIFPATGKADFGGLDWGAAGVTVDNSNIFQSEVQLLSLRAFPENVRIKLGGLVLARSVKFLGKLEASVSDQETREGWWSELRDEIKSHAKVLCCKHIIGYSETCTIFGDVCILTAMGTAAVLKRLAHPTSYFTHVSAVSNSSMLQLTTGDGTSGIMGTGVSGTGSNMQKGAISPNPRANRSSTNQSRSNLQQLQGDGIANSEPSPTFMECLNPMVVPGGVVPLQFPRSASDPSLNAVANPQESGTSSNNTNTPGSTHSSLLIRPQSAHMEGSRGPMSQSKKMWIGDEGQGYDTSVTTPQSARGSAFGLLPPKKPRRPCVAAHVPYNHRTAPFSFMRLVPCASCRRKWVPETLLASTDPPHALQVKGCGQMLEARVCRARKAASGEADAVKISEVLPFVEYDLQRQLILKLKVLGMNAAFGYSCKIQVGNELVIATATCTAVWLKSLPSPPPVQIVRSRDPRSQQELRLASLQRQLEDLMSLNKTTLDIQHSRNKLIVKRRSLVANPTTNSGRFGHPVRKMSLSNASASSLANNGTGVLPDKSRESSGDELPIAMHEERSMASLEESLGSYSATSSSSASGSSTSSSSSSSSEDDTSDGDDSSSLESPPSSSSSSSTEKDDEENTDSHPFDNTVDVAEGAMAAVSFANAEGDQPRSGHTSGSRSPKVSTMNLTEGRSSRLGSSATAATTSSTNAAGVVTTGTELLSKDKKAVIIETIRRKRRMVYKDDRAPFLMEVDDETDSDIIAVLNDWAAPIGIDMVNTLFVPGSVEFPSGIGRNVVVMRRGRIMTPKTTGSYTYTGSPPSSAALNNTLSKLFLEAYLRLCYTVKDMMPCQVLGMTHHVNIAEDGVVEVTVNAMVHKATKTQRLRYLPPPREPFVGAAGFIGDFLPSRRSSGPPPLLVSRSDSALDPLAAAGSSSPPGAVRRAETVQYASSSNVMSTSTALVVPVPVVSSSALYDRDRRRTNSSDSNSTLPGELLLTSSSYVSGTDSEVPTGKVTPLSSAGATYGGSSSRLSMTASSTGRHASLSGAAPPLKAQSSTSGGSAGVSGTGNNTAGAAALNLANQVILTPLSDVPGARVKKYLGPILLHFLKDAIVVRGPTTGSMGSFYYLMVSEASAVARAHVAALGGNALLCYRLVPQESGGRAARSQTYSMFSVTGDAVLLEFASTTAVTSATNTSAEMTTTTGTSMLNRQQSDNNNSSSNFYQQGEMSGSNSSGRFPTFSENETQH